MKLIVIKDENPDKNGIDQFVILVPDDTDPKEYLHDERVYDYCPQATIAATIDLSYEDGIELREAMGDDRTYMG